MAVRTLGRGFSGQDDHRDVVGLINDLVAAINTITAQLDLDAGVTDTDYASNVGTLDTATFSGLTSAPS